MNLINKKVTHKRFGIGSIVKQNDSTVEINFASENKMFVFPDGFVKHLTLHDKNDAYLLLKMIEKKEMDRKEKELQKEADKKQKLENVMLHLEHQKLMKNHKLHAESQMVFWCDEEEQTTSLQEWQVFSGIIKSGINKGKPSKPVRLHQNSAVLLTAVDAGKSEKDRRILGVYMVNEEFIGKFCEDGKIPAHSTFRIKLTEEESNQMLFWNYYVNEKTPDKMTWNSGKHRYFDNVWMAQILREIVALKSDTPDRELAKQFLKHFCKVNHISDWELANPNGALMRV